jgi:hypothetical protein
VGIATGQAYPDALAGGVLQGKIESVMLLTRSNTLSPEPAAALTANKAAISTVTYFGGDLAVSPAVRAAVAAAVDCEWTASVAAALNSRTERYGASGAPG